MFSPGLTSAIMPAVIICELVLLGFLFCIARFYGQKFRETTYHVTYLLPALLFIVLFIISPIAGMGLEWCFIITNASVLVVLVTSGFFLYRKMTGVSR